MTVFLFLFYYGFDESMALPPLEVYYIDFLYGCRHPWRCCAGLLPNVECIMYCSVGVVKCCIIDCSNGIVKCTVVMLVLIVGVHHTEFCEDAII